MKRSDMLTVNNARTSALGLSHSHGSFRSTMENELLAKKSEKATHSEHHAEKPKNDNALKPSFSLSSLSKK
jgi:hypothetical protein